MTSVAQLRDFKDWIGPMVVKELRQGLRTKSFVGVFIGLQVLLIIVTAALAGSDGDSGSQSAWFWGFINLVLLIIMPLRGFNTVSLEARQQTLELVLMTRLTSRRITFGKWIALYAQTLLFSIALLPFIVMRYFLGGNDVATELYLLILFTVISGALTALAVGVSAQPSALLRGAVTIGVIFAFPFSQSALFAFLQFRSSTMTVWASEEFWVTFGATLFVCLFVVLYSIDFGSTYIAPHAENLSTRKRLITFIFVVAILCFAFFDSIGLLELSIVAIILAAIPCVDALCESPAAVSSIYVPFVRRGIGARLAGRLLYPGWQSGLLFTVLITGILGIAYFVAREESGWGSVDRTMLLVVSGFGILIFPLVIILIALPKTKNPFVIYLLIQLMLVVLCFTFLSIDEGGNGSSILLFLSFIPWAAFFSALPFSSYDSHGQTIIIVGFAICCYCLFLLVRALPIFRQIGQLESAVAERLSHERKSLDDQPPSP